MEEERPTCWIRFKKHVKNNLLTYLLVIGVLLGIVVGVMIRAISPESVSERQSMYIGFPGELLIRLLKCIAIPLILTCIIVAIGSLDLTVSKAMGWQLIVLIFATKVVSSIIGLALTLLIAPGEGFQTVGEHGLKKKDVVIADIFLDMFRNLIPANLVRLYVETFETRVISSNESSDLNSLDFEIRYITSVNLLGMIFIAIIIGLTITILQETARNLLLVAAEVYEVAMKLAIWVLWCAPLALFFLILSEILKIEDFGPYFATWGMYIVTLNAAYLVILLIIHPMLLVIVTRANPIKFYGDVLRALVTAYATASSVASMPVVITCLQNHGVDSRLVGFVVPIVCNTNKDGTACFLAVASVFIAQMQNVPLTFGQYLVIIVLSSMGSVAAAGVPFAAVVVLLMVINALGLDQEPIGGIMSVEWLNDRGQTLVNISANCILPKIIAKWNRKLIALKVNPEEGP